MNRRLIKGTILIALYASFALAHSAPSGMEYDPWCCSGIDCAPIPSSKVKVTSAGYAVSLDPGDHPSITHHHDYLVPYGLKIRRSTDGQYHMCFYPDEDTVRCFYAPDQGA